MFDSSRVLFLITRSDAIGGAHIHVRDMAVALRRLGIDATVACGGTGVYSERLRQAGVPVHSLQHLARPIRPWADLRAYREIVGLLRAMRPTLVSIHSSKAGLLGRLACAREGIPMVFTAHGWSFTDGVGSLRTQAFRLAEVAVGRRSARLITVSEFDRRIALEAGVAGADRLRTVHNGMPDGDFPRARPAVQPPRLVMTARLDEQKDHATLLRALGQLRDLPWTLDLIGDGPLKAQLEAQARALLINERIRFLGLRHDVPALLGDSQLFLLISHWEGFPRSILEAMRAGLPVLASDVAGVSESVQTGVNGLLVPRRDGDALAANLRELLCAPERRAAMGVAGRRRFEAEFTFDRMLASTFAVYDEVLGQHGLDARFVPMLTKAGTATR